MTEPHFKRVQRQFAAHLRNPATNPAPVGVEARRLQIYRDLFFNNVQNFIAQGFPVLRAVLDDARWMPLVRGFFSSHTCTSPYFLDIPREFVSWLADAGADEGLEGYPPFMLELAHYEYMELALDVSRESIPERGINPEGDLLLAAPVISPLACLLSYQWPVHRIGPAFLPETPEPCWLMVYRNRADEVGFMALSQGAALLLQTLQDNPLASGEQVLGQLAGVLGQPLDSVARFGRDTLEALRDRDIILGTRLEDVTNLPA